MDEGRKRTILIAASILVAQKAAHLERNSPALQAAISDALGLAEMIGSITAGTRRQING